MAATELVQHLQQAKQRLELMTAMTRLDKYRVLIVDDIGYVKKNDMETQVLFEFIAHRYESGSLIITSNQPLASISFKWAVDRAAAEVSSIERDSAISVTRA